MDWILEAGKLAIRRYVDPNVMQEMLAYRFDPKVEKLCRELLAVHNWEVWERFGSVNYGPVDEVVRERAGGTVSITWREATDEDLARIKALWDDPFHEGKWLTRLRERESRLDRSELDRLERIFGGSRQPVA